MFYQIFSRDNDVNGNPYRLICLYSVDGELVKLIESRSSSSNWVFRNSRDFGELPSAHLTKREYRDFKARYSHVTFEED